MSRGELQAIGSGVRLEEGQGHYGGGGDDVDADDDDDDDDDNNNSHTNSHDIYNRITQHIPLPQVCARGTCRV